MDTKAYIESGIIESYVLGLASSEEQAELEMLCAQYPEIRKAVTDFELQLEKQAFNDAVEPPVDLREKIMSQFLNEFTSSKNSDAANTPIIPITSADTKAFSNKSFWKYFAAASVILLVASAALNVYLYNNYQSTSSKYQAILTEKNSLQANNEIFQTKLDGLEQSMHIIQNPDVKEIILKGVAGKENNLAAVYWDSKTKDVYFMPTNMDSIPSGKQYQLWAIVDGKPVDAGLVGDCNGLCKMKNIPSAQAFAITLENKGGSSTPTLSAMYVMGKI